MVDSTDLTEQVLNTDGEIWTGNMITPSIEEFFKVSVTAFDQTASTSFTLPNATRYTTAGPLKLDSISYTSSGTLYNLRPYVRNSGTSLSVIGAKIRLYCDDPFVSAISNGYVDLPNIDPGSTVGSNSAIFVRVIDSLFTTGHFNLRAEITKDDWPYWIDSIQLIIPPNAVEDEQNEVPTEYLLSQNWPNPFNPSTSIQYAISGTQLITLKVYDVLGREVTLLVNENKPAGRYEIEFNDAKLPSGVYFYQLRAGSFTQTRKMILVK